MEKERRIKKEYLKQSYDSLREESDIYKRKFLNGKNQYERDFNLGVEVGLKLAAGRLKQKYNL